MSVRESLDRALELTRAPAAQHAFTALMEGTARAEAEAADARRKAGLSLGPLDGMLVSIKDLFDVAGAVTTAGSKIRRNAAPASADAPTIARLRRAGAVLIGRTNMSEFAFSGLGLNPHYGTPGNARDAARVPGGSTAGGAVAVGLGITPLTLGTDTGGSTRIPAAFNGIVGFKPTSPRVPRTGAFPLSYTLDSIGPMGVDVATCAAADAVLAGAAPEPLPEIRLKGLRIGVPRGWLFTEMEPEVAAAFEAGLTELSRQGAQIEDIDLDGLFGQMRDTLALAPIAACEAAEIHMDAIAVAAQDFDPRVLSRIMGGHAVLARAYIRALNRREALKPELGRRIAGLDCLMLPTTAIRAPLIQPLVASDEAFTRTNLLTLRNTNPFNFFDCPALSVPLPVDGLPVGLSLVGSPFSDRRLFALGAAAERALRG